MSTVTTASETSEYRLIRWAGIAGLLGAVIMLVGDMLFYGRVDSSTDNITMMGVVPLWRLYLGGLLGIISGVFYVLGAGQVYLATRPAGRYWAFTIAGAFFTMMVFNGAYHTAFPVLGLASQLAVSNPDAGALALAQAEDYLRWLRLFGAIPQLLFTAAFALVVVRGKTEYPRWLAPFTPLVLLLTLPLITGQFSGLLYVVFQGGIANIVFALFFAITTAALWSGRYQPTDEPAVLEGGSAETA